MKCIRKRSLINDGLTKIFLKVLKQKHPRNSLKAKFITSFLPGSDFDDSTLQNICSVSRISVLL